MSRAPLQPHGTRSCASAAARPAAAGRGMARRGRGGGGGGGMSSGGRRCAAPQPGQAKSVVPFSTSSVSPQPAQRTSTASGAGVAIGGEKGKGKVQVSLVFLGTLSYGRIALQLSNFTFYSIFVSVIVPTPTHLRPCLDVVVFTSIHMCWGGLEWNLN